MRKSAPNFLSTKAHMIEHTYFDIKFFYQQVYSRRLKRQFENGNTLMYMQSIIMLPGMSA